MKKDTYAKPKKNLHYYKKKYLSESIHSDDSFSIIIFIHLNI